MTLILAHRNRGITRNLTINDADGNTVTPGVNDKVRVVIGRDGYLNSDAAPTGVFAVTSGTATANGSTLTKGATNQLRIDASDMAFSPGAYTLYFDFFDNADSSEWKNVDRQVFMLEGS